MMCGSVYHLIIWQLTEYHENLNDIRPDEYGPDPNTRVKIIGHNHDYRENARIFFSHPEND